MDDFSILAPRQPLTPAPYAQYAPIADYASTAGTALTAAQAHSVFNRAFAANQLNTSATPAAGEVLGYDGSSLVWTNANGAAAELIIQGPGTTNSPSDWTNVVRAVVSETVGAGACRFSGDGAGLTNVNGVLNVKAFGAKGDGESDDTGAIQGAMDALQSVVATKHDSFIFRGGNIRSLRPISLLPTVGSEANQVLAVRMRERT